MRSLRLLALKDLLDRYWAVIKASWQIRHQLEVPARSSDEIAFLPAALELQEKPPSPLPRLTAWLLIIFFVIAVLWAVFGKIDIVAVAHGKIVPDERVKLIQALDSAKIQAIHVEDGQLVKQGQLLIELDATTRIADYQRTYEMLISMQLQQARNQALLDAIKRKQLPILIKPADASAAAYLSAQKLLNSQYREFTVKIAAEQLEIAKRQAELEAAKDQVEKLEQTLPIAKQKEADYVDLLKDGYVSKHNYLAQQQSRIEQEQDLAVYRNKVRESQEGILGSEKRKEFIVAELRRSTLQELHETAQKIIQLEQELIKLASQKQLMRLTAPIAGYIQQLSVHTIGGVVTAAQTLMVIVPIDNAIEAEVWLENKDVGFVNPGQEATVKIETFPYSRYGTIKGSVQTVSSDAVSDEKKGLIFHSQIALAKNSIQIENKTVNLSPGMAVTVEIKTGKRRLIEYFLSPLIQYTSESLKER